MTVLIAPHVSPIIISAHLRNAYLPVLLITTLTIFSVGPAPTLAWPALLQHSAYLVRLLFCTISTAACGPVLPAPSSTPLPLCVSHAQPTALLALLLVALSALRACW